MLYGCRTSEFIVWSGTEGVKGVREIPGGFPLEFYLPINYLLRMQGANGVEILNGGVQSIGVAPWGFKFFFFIKNNGGRHGGFLLHYSDDNGWRVFSCRFSRRILMTGSSFDRIMFNRCWRFSRILIDWFSPRILGLPWKFLGFGRKGASGRRGLGFAWEFGRVNNGFGNCSLIVRACNKRSNTVRDPKRQLRLVYFLSWESKQNSIWMSGSFIEEVV